MTASTTSRNTLASALKLGIEKLRATSDSARLDAEILLAAALNRPRSHLIAYADAALSLEAEAQFNQWLTQRAAGIPVAYLTGRREFWSLDLEVTPDVLMPRPETELLVEQALRRLPQQQPSRVLDLGTGSGAIALALANERPRAQVIAIDRSAAALEVARRNAERLNLANITFLHGDWYAPLQAAGLDAHFDLIVSNPPYIAAADPALQTPELRAEPLMALTSGPTGLECLETIAQHAGEHLVPSGWLMVEHGADQGPAVAAIFTRRGLHEVSTAADFAGRDRVTLGRR